MENSHFIVFFTAYQCCNLATAGASDSIMTAYLACITITAPLTCYRTLWIVMLLLLLNIWNVVISFLFHFILLLLLVVGKLFYDMHVWWRLSCVCGAIVRVSSTISTASIFHRYANSTACCVVLHSRRPSRTLWSKFAFMWWHYSLVNLCSRVDLVWILLNDSFNAVFLPTLTLSVILISLLQTVLIYDNVVLLLAALNDWLEFTIHIC